MLDRGRYVFCAVEPEPDDLKPLVRIRVEGRTNLVLDQQVADEHGWEYPAVSAMVTLPVYAAPDAIDLTAEITSALSKRGITCRVFRRAARSLQTVVESSLGKLLDVQQLPSGHDQIANR